MNTIPLDVLLDLINFSDMEGANEKLKARFLFARWVDENRGDIEIVSTLDGQVVHSVKRVAPTTDVPVNSKVDSTSDARVVNNAVRHQYRVLSEEEKGLVQEIKDIGQKFIDMLEQAPSKREYSIATTKMQEAVMWAVKGVTS